MGLVSDSGMEADCLIHSHIDRSWTYFFRHCSDCSFFCLKIKILSVK